MAKGTLFVYMADDIGDKSRSVPIDEIEDVRGQVWRTFAVGDQYALEAPGMHIRLLYGKEGDVIHQHQLFVYRGTNKLHETSADGKLLTERFFQECEKALALPSQIGR